MTSPRLVVRYFGPGRDKMWDRLTHVLAYTARQQLPSWRLDIAAIEPIDGTVYSPRGVQGYVWNTHKLDAWTAIVDAAEDGEPILLLDADTVILRPLDDVWAHPFDVAYTVKPETAALPFNGGVVFVRATAAAREFMGLWRAKNRLFLENPQEFDVWRNFGGLNQASLGAVLRQKQHHAAIKKLPCLEWNCEDEHWGQFETGVTRILHVKSHLQRAIFQMVKPEDGERPLVALWRQLEVHAMKDESQPPNDSRVITPPDLEDQMVRPGDLEAPAVRPEDLSTPEPPRLNRRQRRRIENTRPPIGDTPVP